MSPVCFLYICCCIGLALIRVRMVVLVVRRRFLLNGRPVNLLPFLGMIVLMFWTLFMGQQEPVYR